MSRVDDEMPSFDDIKNPTDSNIAVDQPIVEIDEHELDKAQAKKYDFEVVLKSKDVMCGGAPAPEIFATENKLAILFFLELDQDKNREYLAVFKISGLRGFEQKSNIGGYDHDCVFEPYGWSNVWQRKAKDSDIIELVFGFQDTSVKCRCAEFEYIVIDEDKV